MSWKTVLAIYILFWVMSGFLVLPFEARRRGTPDVPKVPGEAEGAPAHFKPLRAVMWTTILASVLFGLFYANYVEGWVTPDMLDVLRR